MCGTDLSRPGLIFSKLRERREAQGVELAELPREPGPGPGTPPHISPLRTSDINTSAVTIMSTSTSQSSEVVLICLIKESEKNVIKKIQLNHNTKYAMITHYLILFEYQF